MQVRTILAKVSAQHLSADLFILDEFQRFNVLLDSQSQGYDTLIAQEVFRKTKQTNFTFISYSF